MNEAALLRAVIACNGNGRKITAPGRRVARNKRGSNAADDIACMTAEPPQVTLLDGRASLNEAALVGPLA